MIFVWGVGPFLAGTTFGTALTWSVSSEAAPDQGSGYTHLKASVEPLEGVTIAYAEVTEL